MSNRRGEEEINGEGAGGRFTVQPERELEANWEVDLAKKLEDYLLKICSGQVTDSENLDNISVNFAEAALLVQGSVQVYSRKVDYFYNLVLHALEFVSQKRQQDQLEGTPVLPEESGSHTVADEENDVFWGLDDIPVEVKNCLDSPNGKETPLNPFVKPPANLVVLEGDCLDTSGDGTELDSYLLATNDLYRDFILLDTYDAVVVNEFLDGDENCKGQSGVFRGSTDRKSFQSPTRRSGGTAYKSSLGRNKDSNLNPSPRVDCSFDANGFNMGPDPPADINFVDSNNGFDMDDIYSEPGAFNDSDDDDPWKPLNPHEPGNLKVQPFKKVKPVRRNGVKSTKQAFISTVFPLAKLHGTISPELKEIWETRHKAFVKERVSQSPPLYEKLRQSLANEGRETWDAFGHPGDYSEVKGYDSGYPDLEQPDFDLPESMYMDDVPLHNDKHDDGTAHFETNEAFEHGDEVSHANLEDLCRSHLDALLASIAETEKQTELAARVSSWKQIIEDNLEEQDSHPPFDIHEYGARIIDRLSLEVDNENVVSFVDVVKGQEKYEVARTFSALLQLVNNGDVDLDRSGENGKSVCYTAVNPFHVRLLSHDKKREEPQFRLPKKRVKSPSRKGSSKAKREKFPTMNPSPEFGSSVMSSQQSCKFSVKLGKLGGVRCTPESKRRRKSRFVEPVNLHSSG